MNTKYVKTTCRIQWIDDQGKPTPDSNPAVAIATRTAHPIIIDGRDCGSTDEQSFPICQEHLDRLNDENYRGWQVSPLPVKQ